MTPKKILVAGIGNIFFGDDAFGVEVIRELLLLPSLPEGVEVKDFGIRSFDLAYAIMDGYDTVILVDAAARGEPPGTYYLIEPYLADLESENAVPPDGHTMNPVSVLQLVQSLGKIKSRVFVVGCEPERLECEDGEFGLSEAVHNAIPGTIDLIQSLLHDLLHDQPVSNPKLTPSSRR